MERWEGMPIESFLTALGSTEPVPGGGTAAALAGAVAAALVRKVAALAQRRGRNVGEAVERADAFLRKFLELGQADAEAYAAVVAAQRGGGEALAKALVRAAGVPLEVAQKSLALMDLAERLLPACPKGVRSDLACAARLAWAACLAALYTVDANAQSIQDAKFREELGRARAELADLAEEKAAFVLAPLEEELALWLGERDSNPH
ncbi:cyclodeaminase/cyclohydrolase family protein [Thermus sp.]|uniref:cyclodeaminase/cyclohydrolase family protein n=1 Tax=Thermus sp. TaxID=275 RepID=UPI00261FAA88|nr:cyclodeaminase/cyclohydrolase family protein [Thermus sp.]MCX7850246.1 cyclodeaminase/cyclohydrolase family protein [Thermus sp.]